MLRKASSVTKRTSTTVLLGAADSFAELVAVRVIGAFPHKPNVADVVLRDCLNDERPRREWPYHRSVVVATVACIRFRVDRSYAEGTLVCGIF